MKRRTLLAEIASPISPRVSTFSVHGVEVSAQTSTEEYTVQQDIYSFTTFEVSALIACGDLELRATPGWYYFGLGRQDIKVGHKEFDDRYIIKSDDADAARWWLNATLCEALLGTYEPTALNPFRFALRQGRVTLRACAQENGRTLNHAPVPRSETALVAMKAVVQRNVEIADDMARRAAQIGGKARGSVWHADERFQLLFHVAGCDVTIDFPWQVAGHARGGLRTRIRMSIVASADFAIWRKSETWEMPPRSKRVKPQEATFDKLALGDVEDEANEEFRTKDGPWRMFAYASSLPLPTLPAIAEKFGFDWAYVSGSTLALGWERLELEPTLWLVAMRELASLVAVQRSAGPYR